jgi:hypothetical protein
MSAHMPSVTGGRERDGAKRHQKNLPEHIERCDISRIAFQRWQTLSWHIATLLLVYVAEAPSKRLLSRLTRHTGVGVCVCVPVPRHAQPISACVNMYVYPQRHISGLWGARKYAKHGTCTQVYTTCVTILVYHVHGVFVYLKTWDRGRRVDLGRCCE